MTIATSQIIDRTVSQLPPDEQTLVPLRAGANLPAVTAPPSMLSLLERAVTAGMPPEGLERLVALARSMRADAAAEAYAAAMAAFQSECKPIRKTSEAKITTKSGVQYGYKYAELDTIADAIRPLLAKHGLSYSWDSTEDKGSIKCVCSVRHSAGHVQTATFTCPTDSAAAMSGAQKSAAALTYARRQSLVQALGLTTGDGDPDGAAGGYAGNGGYAGEGDGSHIAFVSDHEAANLEAAILDVGGTVTKFCQRMQVETLAQLPKSRLAEAHRLIAERREYNKNGGRQ